MESRTVTDPLLIGEALCGESGFEGLGGQCTGRFGALWEYLLPWLETVDHLSQITVPAPGQTPTRTPSRSLYFRQDQS